MARALISVSDKTGLIPFAQGLVSLGFELISTGGTFRLLKDAGIPVLSIDSVTGFPEMMDGRVKTLHPKIHGGLLALRDHPAHVEAAKAHGIEFIDLVVVNLYPFEATIAKPNVALEEAIENIDIGGPSMIRSAAKNYHHVAVIVDPKHYATVLEELQNSGRTLSLTTKQQLALEAFTHTSRYDGIISSYLGQQFVAEHFPKEIRPVLSQVSTLRYGENPHQNAAFYALAGEKGLPDMTIHQGKELSYNNLLDTDAAWQMVTALPGTAAVIIKHNNPCGVATDTTLAGAYTKALAADSVSAFGGIVGLNQPVHADTAALLTQTFLEVVIAPEFSPEALEILAQKPNLRVISLPASTAAQALTYRHVQGGFLVQTPDHAPIDPTGWDTVTEAKADTTTKAEMAFAFSVVRAVKSNAIVVTKNGQTLGIGAGQMSRVEAVEIALKKAGEQAKGAVLASDAFFPFNDSVTLAAAAGITAIVQPGGSKKDQDSIDACNQNGIAMCLTGVRHFKH